VSATPSNVDTEGETRETQWGVLTEPLGLSPSFSAGRGERNLENKESNRQRGPTEGEEHQSREGKPPIRNKGKGT